MATIQDVARVSGVSAATVSRVLNNNYKVSEKTRKLVLDAIEKLDYRPNIVGRNLGRSKNRTILVVSGVIDDDMIRGAASAAKELGYDIILSYSPLNSDNDALKYFENGLAGGIMFMNFFSGDKQKIELCRRCPVVQCADYLDIPESYAVSIDDEAACYQMTEMLIKEGHRRFAFIGHRSIPDHTMHYSMERENGFRRALKDGGIPEDRQSLHLFEWKINSYYGAIKVAQQWLELPKDERPDAVVCVNDTTALGFVNTLLRAGIRIPQEVAVTGFDNRRSVTAFPQITTVAQPFFEMGAESIRMLVGIMNGEERTPRRVLLDHRIIVRGSTDPTKD